MPRRALIATVLWLVVLGCAGGGRAPTLSVPAHDTAAWEDASRQSTIGEPESPLHRSGELRISRTLGERPRREVLCRISRGKLDAAWRARETERLRDAWFCRYETAGGKLAAVCGDFSPGGGQGLLLAGRRTTYPFSAGYSTGAAFRIASRASWWDDIFRGVALCLRGRRWSSSGWTARPRAERGGTVVTLPEDVRGLHVLRRIGAAELGISVVSGPAANGTLWGTICRFDGGGTRGAAELAFSRGGTAWATGLRRRGPLRLALLLYAASHGYDSPLGGLPGGGLGGGTMRRGCCWTAARRIGRCTVSAAVERLTRSDGSRETVENDRRIECRCRGKTWELRIAGRRTSERRETVVPWPADASTVSGERTSGSLRCRWTPASRLGLHLSAGTARERDGCAGFIAPALSCEPVAGATIRTGIAWWRGEPGIALYLYERTVPGRYPWRRLAGEGRRGTIALEADAGPFRIAGWISFEAGDGTEGGLNCTIFSR